MTGPAEGKIPVDIKLKVKDRVFKVSSYIHLKGFSNAKVTHLDVEDLDINADSEGFFVKIIPVKNGFVIIAPSDITIDGVRTRKVILEGLGIIRPNERQIAWFGVKVRGFYLGFRKEIISRLEKLCEEITKNRK